MSRELPDCHSYRAGEEGESTDGICENGGGVGRTGTSHRILCSHWDRPVKSMHLSFQRGLSFSWCFCCCCLFFVFIRSGFTLSPNYFTTLFFLSRIPMWFGGLLRTRGLLCSEQDLCLLTSCHVLWVMEAERICQCEDGEWVSGLP